MFIQRIFILLGALLLSHFVLSFQNKKASSQLERGDLIGVQESLNKSFAKEPVNPFGHYIYSLLYLKSEFSRSNLDSAYFHVNKAISDWALIDEKEKEKLSKSYVYPTKLTQLKSLIEEKAFDLAATKNSVEGYDYFIRMYAGAEQVVKAIENSSSVAFIDAKEENTSFAYKSFLQNYPSSKYISEATSLYEDRVFEEKLTDGDLHSHLNFLKEHPNSPYRNKVEEFIFFQTIFEHNVSSYFEFIRKFPTSHMVKTAYDFLYHIYAENNQLDDFFKNFKELPQYDSLLKIYQLSLNKIGYVSVGETILLIKSDRAHFEIPANSFSTEVCDFNDSDYIVSNRVVANLQGKIIYKGNFSSVEDLGYGIIKVLMSQGVKLLHKTGIELLNRQSFDDVGFLGNKFFKIKKKDHWGLATLFGEIILEPQFDEIEFINGLIILSKNLRFSIYNKNNTLDDINFSYDDIEPIGTELLLVFNDDNEGLINKNGDFLIPLGSHEIGEIGDYFSVKKQEKIELYNIEGKIVLADVSRLTFNNNFINYQKGTTWNLSPIDDLSNIISYDSIKLLSDHIVAFFGSDSSFIRFNNSTSLNLKNTGTFKLLEPTQYTLKNDSSTYILTYDKDGVKRMYNSKGLKILGGWFGEASVISHDLFLIEEGGKKGISDLSGKNVLPIEYDGIGDYVDGNVNLIKGGKFGLFNYPLRKTIDANYDGRFHPLNNQMVVANRNKKLGVIDFDDNQFIDFEFDEIIKWTDSTVLLNKKGEWSLRNLITGDSASVHSVDSILENGDEKIIEYRAGSGSGLLSNTRGKILEAQFDKIVNLKIDNNLYFLATKNFELAEILVLALFNYEGDVIWSRGVSKTEAKTLICLN